MRTLTLRTTLRSTSAARPSRPHSAPILECSASRRCRRCSAELATLTAFAMALGLIIWISRTVIDYRRWNRLAKVQTDVHTKLLDRFTSTEDLLAYIQSPAGAKFLESSPIRLDAGSRSLGAPLGRVLWSVPSRPGPGGCRYRPAGDELAAARRSRATDPCFGYSGTRPGRGVRCSALASFLIWRRLGLVEPASAKGSGPYVS